MGAGREDVRKEWIQLFLADGWCQLVLASSHEMHSYLPFLGPCLTCLGLNLCSKKECKIKPSCTNVYYMIILTSKLCLAGILSSVLGFCH